MCAIGPPSPKATEGQGGEFMFKDYYEVRDWVENFIPQVYGKENLGLSRIEYLLKLLKNPEKKFKSVHIAGTSGKGSTAFYTARLLRQKGFKVGLHVSPHLVDIRERMQIFSSRHPGGSETTDKQSFSSNRIYTNRRDSIASLQNDGFMSMKRFISLFNQIKPVVEQMGASQVGFPSYFEILVAASFKYFAEEEVDWAVVEVGLGGRLDATNVLESRIAVITNIGLDHTEILGNTIEKIAFEKAGIIKVKVPVVTAVTGKALSVIEKIAVKNKSQLIKVSTQKPPIGLSNRGISPSALLALSALKALKIRVNDAEIDKAFSANFPGRFEEINDLVILDGAHNTDKIKALINFVRNSKQSRLRRDPVNRNLTLNTVLVIAFKKGKKWKKMLDQLLKDLPIKRVIATQFNAVTDTGPTPSQRLRGVNKFGFVPAEEIEKYLKSFQEVRAIKNSQEAVFKAVNERKRDELVLVTGSLYLVGEVRTMWELSEV
ncbi:MAG: Mur ligase family protein [Candidatus Curtissbacteria bacterium]|nr:Mur ligase family protein [Candidatus Curtissbacteria bacterium]